MRSRARGSSSAVRPAEADGAQGRRLGLRRSSSRSRCAREVLSVASVSGVTISISDLASLSKQDTVTAQNVIPCNFRRNAERCLSLYGSVFLRCSRFSTFLRLLTVAAKKARKNGSLKNRTAYSLRAVIFQPKLLPQANV